MELFDRVKTHEGFDHFETLKRIDPLNDKEVEVTKIVCKDPLAIGGRPGGTIRDIIPEDFPKVFGVKMQDAGAKNLGVQKSSTTNPTSMMNIFCLA